MIHTAEQNPKDAAMIETITNHTLFNAYLFGPKNIATDSTVRLFQQGDFLLHFAGVYEPWNIYRMMNYVLQGKPIDTILFDNWRANPPKNKEGAGLKRTEM